MAWRSRVWGAAAYWLARGTLTSRLVLTFSLAALIVLHIQLAHGGLEYHFGIFVSLALLLVCLDWRPIVFAAVLFAVHHLLFDRLQAAGFNSTPRWLRAVVRWWVRWSPP